MRYPAQTAINKRRAHKAGFALVQGVTERRAAPKPYKVSWGAPPFRDRSSCC